MHPSTPLRQQWFGNVRGDLLAGVVVALALIPESIAFSIIAGVDPSVGLYASFSIAVITAIVGGRPGMISAATGAMALVMVVLVRDHGLQYLLAATLLTGMLQIAAGALKLATLMRFISRSVITGFVNALAILIFAAQLPELIGVPGLVYPIVVGGLLLIYGLPWLGRALVPGIGLLPLVVGLALAAGSAAPALLLPVLLTGLAAMAALWRWSPGLVVPPTLVAIVLLTGLSLYFGWAVPTVGDKGALPDRLPVFLLPDVPLTWETLRIIAPVSATLAVVGLLESLMTARIIDDMTDTPSDRHRECVGQGTANLMTGFFGGMAGCAMIGQSVINVKSGGRGRLSSFVAGSVLLLMVVFAGDWVGRIPMAALVAVMVMVSISTFSWRSLRDLAYHPRSSNVVMLGTVVVTVATGDLARGVLTGVVLSAVFFARKVGRVLDVDSRLDTDGRTRRYVVRGQVFFASANAFGDAFDLLEPVDQVVIDLTDAHFWDLSAIGALDTVVMKLRARGVLVETVGLNAASATLIERLGVHDKPGAAAPSGH